MLFRSWHFESPKVAQLMEETVSCLTNPEHPSDWFGDHYIEKDEKIIKDTAFKNWVADCKNYKKQLSELWEKYLKACEMRKQANVKAKAWRDTELDKLRAQMSEVSRLYTEGMQEYDVIVANAKQEHSNFKAKGKPKRNK